MSRTSYEEYSRLFIRPDHPRLENMRRRRVTLDAVSYGMRVVLWGRFIDGHGVTEAGSLSEERVPMSGQRSVVITGASSGIGKSTA